MIFVALLPSLNEAEVKIFREKDSNDTLFSDKLFVFANKIDAATDVISNIDDTHKEWIGKYIKNTNKHRIIFGSALSYLYGNKIYTDKNNEKFYNNFLAVKDKLPHGDGIDEIREQLEKYNKNERFQVLKSSIINLEKDFLNICNLIRQNFESIKKTDSKIFDINCVEKILNIR